MCVAGTYFGSASVRLRQRVLVKRVLHLSNKSAMGATPAPIWDDEGGQLRSDSVLGTWCCAKNNQMMEMKDAKVYERPQNCCFRKPPDWIVLGPNGYRTSNRKCS